MRHGWRGLARGDVRWSAFHRDPRPIFPSGRVAYSRFRATCKNGASEPAWDDAGGRWRHELTRWFTVYLGEVVQLTMLEIQLETPAGVSSFLFTYGVSCTDEARCDVARTPARLCHITPHELRIHRSHKPHPWLAEKAAAVPTLTLHPCLNLCPQLTTPTSSRPGLRHPDISASSPPSHGSS